VRLDVNGESLLVAEGATIADLVRQLGLERGRVAVERNGTVVPRAEHASVRLSGADRIEIVAFVGGG
jgi:sulfur carrier protein